MDGWDGCWGWWGWRRVLGVGQTLCPSVPGLNTASVLLGQRALGGSRSWQGLPRSFVTLGPHRDPTGAPQPPPCLPEGGQEAVIVTPGSCQVQPAAVRRVQAPGGLYGSESPRAAGSEISETPLPTPPSPWAEPKEPAARLGVGVWVLPASGRADGATSPWWDAPAPCYLDQVGRRSPSLLKVLLPMLLLHFEGEAGAQDPLGTAGDRVCGCQPRHHYQPGHPPASGVDFSPFSPIPAGQEAQGPSPHPTHGGQREEGDAEQREAGREHPSQPRLRRLVPVADGSEGDLPGGRTGGGLEGAPPLLVPSRGWGAAVAELTVPHHRESA